MKYSTQKDIDKLVRQLVRQGWIFWRGAKHGRLKHPLARTTLTIPGSPGDRNAANNFARDVMRVLEDTSKACPAEQIRALAKQYHDIHPSLHQRSGV